MSELFRRRCSCRWSLPAAVAVAWFYLWSGAGQLPLAAGASSVPKEAQEAFDKQQYEQVLEQLAKLEKEQGAAPDMYRRLRSVPISNLVIPRTHSTSMTSWNSRSSKMRCLSFEKWRWGSSLSW